MGKSELKYIQRPKNSLWTKLNSGNKAKMHLVSHERCSTNWFIIINRKKNVDFRVVLCSNKGPRSPVLNEGKIKYLEWTNFKWNKN